MKLDINGVEVHSELSHNRHPVDGAMVGGGFTMVLKLSDVLSRGEELSINHLNFSFGH